MILALTDTDISENVLTILGEMVQHRGGQIDLTSIDTNVDISSLLIDTGVKMIDT